MQTGLHFNDMLSVDRLVWVHASIVSVAIDTVMFFTLPSCKTTKLQNQAQVDGNITLFVMEQGSLRSESRL